MLIMIIIIIIISGWVYGYWIHYINIFSVFKVYGENSAGVLVP